jgi:hypothetical protein
MGSSEFKYQALCMHVEVHRLAVGVSYVPTGRPDKAQHKLGLFWAFRCILNSHNRLVPYHWSMLGQGSTSYFQLSCGQLQN